MTLRQLEVKEAELGRASRKFKDHLRVRTANLEDVRAVLDSEPGSALLEIRRYQPVDFKAGNFGAPRWAGLLLAGFDDPVLVDLGPVEATEQALPLLLEPALQEAADQAAGKLYRQLLVDSGLEARIAGLKRLYLAADGALALVPFARLVLPDGRPWVARQEVRLLPTGRDLLRPASDRPAKGLLALGGIDFGPLPAAAPDNTTALAPAEPAGDDIVLTSGGDEQTLAGAAERTRAALGGFQALPASGPEAEAVAAWYRRYRKDEPAEVWTGAEAGEARLKAHAPPPRVLHLATHGFYLPEDASPRPLLLAGITLAGANGTAVDGEDGILHALEAAGLNLEGTELVVLSACETGQGSVDYGEGVDGLVRALRIAGARQVLMTLWPVNDGEAKAFMEGFYRAWLGRTDGDAAAALRELQAAYADDPDPARADPRRWAPYVLAGR